MIDSAAQVFGAPSGSPSVDVVPLPAKIGELTLENDFLERALTTNDVWAMDTTYIPIAQGFVYLTAVKDIHSRAVLAHRVAITLEASVAVEALQEAIDRYGAPNIVNTDQGKPVHRASVCGLRQDIRGETVDGRQEPRGETACSSNGTGGR